MTEPQEPTEDRPEGAPDSAPRGVPWAGVVSSASAASAPTPEEPVSAPDAADSPWASILSGESPATPASAPDPAPDDAPEPTHADGLRPWTPDAPRDDAATGDDVRDDESAGDDADPADDDPADDDAAPVLDPVTGGAAVLAGTAETAPLRGEGVDEDSEDPADAGEDADPTQALPSVILPGEPTSDGPLDETAETVAPDRDWMGILAFVTGALLLSPIAIVFGHLGLSAAKKGRARHRSFALAGVILGWIGFIALGVSAYFLLAERTSPEEIDIQAQQDVSALGAAAATAAVETGLVPEVSQSGDGYTVAGGAVASELTTAHTLAFTGSTASDWCLDVTFEGGTVEAFRYTATEGMSEGACLTPEAE